MKHLEGLNPAQKEAVLQTEGPVLILAGAGSGKTKTVTHRIIHLIKQGVAPSSILAVTFTNKAAKEMRERVQKVLADDDKINFSFGYYEKPFMSTFHSLGVHIIKENSREVGTTRHFNIFDRNDSKKAVKEGIVKVGLDPKQFEPNKILSIISRQKGDFVTHTKFEESVGNDYTRQIISKVWKIYEEKMKKENALDFDDLLLRTALLLKENEQVRKHYQKLWRYIHIDEYQDTNKVQYEIIRSLAGKSVNVCAVGDDDQNIYNFRGADVKNILNFEKDYSGTKTIILGQNYRSTKTVIDAANDVIKKNKVRKEKDIFTENEQGEKIMVLNAYTETQEARQVALQTKKLMDGGASPSEIAVLYRANFQSRALEEAFLAENLPYQVLGTKFFDRKEIKDIISFIKAGLNPESLSDVNRVINVPPRGIGKTTILKLFSGKRDELPATAELKVQNFYDMLKDIRNCALKEKPSDVIKYVMLTTGIEAKLKEGSEEDQEKLDNIKELVTLATRYDIIPVPEGVEKLLEDASLATDQDEMDQKQQKDAVKLMTVHASKGLEFDNIFVTGLEDTLFPSKREGNNSEAQKEEERRLFYVALTRARKRLFLTYASVRMIFGSRQMNPPSEFIYDIRDELIEYGDNVNEGGVKNGIGQKIEYLEW